MNDFLMLAQDGGGLLGRLLCTFVGGATIGAAISAVILRAAISLYNKFTDGSVDELEFGRAFTIALVNFVATFLTSAFLEFAFNSMGGDPGILIVGAIVRLGVSVLITTVVLSSMLPASFGQALAITGCYFLIAIAVGIAIGVVVVGVLFAMGSLAR